MYVVKIKVVVRVVVTLGRGVGMTAFWEQAALMMLGLKVCRTTGVVMVRSPVAFMLVVAFKPAVVLLLIGDVELPVKDGPLPADLKYMTRLLADTVPLLVDVVLLSADVVL